MSMAFEISEEDVILSVEKNTGINISEQTAEMIINVIDHDYIDRAALRGGTFLEDQMDAALDAIWEEVQTHFNEEELV